MNKQTLAMTIIVVMTLLVASVAISSESNGTIVYITNSDELKTAIGSASEGDMLILNDDIVVSSSAQLAQSTEDGSILVESTGVKCEFTIGESITIDLNGHTIKWAEEIITSKYNQVPVFFQIDSGAMVTVEDSIGTGSVDAEAGSNTSYGFYITGNGGLTVNDGTFYGAPTAVEVYTGRLVVNGGNFQLADTAGADTSSEDYSKHVVNVIDANNGDGSGAIALRGGTFCYDYSDNPETTGNGYVAKGYMMGAGNTIAPDSSVTMVAQNQNGERFATIQEAVDKTVDGTITLLDDVEMALGENLLIYSNMDITLDVSEFDVSCATGNLILNNGNLSLKGSGSLQATGINNVLTNNGTVDIAEVQITGKGNQVIYNSGNLTIESGTFSNTNATNNTTVINHSDSNLIINGGSFTHIGGRVVSAYSDTIITSGTFHINEGNTDNTGGLFGLSEQYTIAGGSFDFYVNSLVKSPYSYSNGTVSLDDTKVVATIEKNGVTVSYDSLSSAVAAAVSGDTIVMQQSSTDVGRININAQKNITIDLNGQTITFAANSQNVYNAFVVQYGTLNLTGMGTVKESDTGRYYAPVIVYGASNEAQIGFSTVNVGADVTLEGYAGIMVLNKTTNAHAYGVTVNLNGKVNTYTDSLGANGYAVYVNGSIVDESENAPKININDGAVLNSTGLGIYAAGYAHWTIGAATINGPTGIEIRAGTLTINESANITASATPADSDPNGDGSTTDGAGIAIVQHTTKLPIEVKINGGTIKGYYAVYQNDTQGNGSESISKIEISITDGTFESINGGTMALFIGDAEIIGAVVSGGTFSSDVSEYCVDGMVTVVDDAGNFTVESGYTVEFITDDEANPTVVRVPAGEVVDPNSIPSAPENYMYEWSYTVEGDQVIYWDPSSAVTENLTLTGTLYISEVTVSVPTPVISSDTVTFSVEYDCVVAIDKDRTGYQWGLVSSDEPDGFEATYSIDISTYGTYAVVVTVYDVDGVMGLGMTTFVYRAPTPVDSEEPAPEIPEFDITHSGDEVAETVTSETVIITSSDDHSDISLDIVFDTPDPADDKVADISIRGSVGGGAVSITVVPMTTEEVIGHIEDVVAPIKETLSVVEEHIVTVDVTLTNVTLDQMIIKVPAKGPDDTYFGSAVAYYIDENGNRSMATSQIVGDEVWIYTDRNTIYTVIPTSFVESPLFEDDPTVDGGETIVPPFPWDDDDEFIPPIVPSQTEDSNDDDTVTIVACAAASVVAALMAVFLIMLYRKD